MKIAIVNNRYFISGGPERYLFNITELLESKGHSIFPFSIQHKQNHKSEYDNFWLSPIGDGNTTYAHEHKKTIGTIIKVFSRMTYSFEASRKFKTFLKTVRPDIIYILNYQNNFSASIINVAHKLKIPIVHRISDFGIICSNNFFYRFDTFQICEACLEHNKLFAIKNKCVKKSYVYSCIKVFSSFISKINRINKKIDAFIIPAKFTLNKFAQYGIEQQKLIHIPTFFNFKTINESTIAYGDFALYVGRIDQDKGIRTLVDSFINTNRKLIIIGFSSSNYDIVIKDYLKDKNHNIEFHGKKNFQEIQTYLAQCLFTIQPSDWYDNMPNTILESYAFKKAVIAPSIGSFLELVDDAQTGLLFKYRDSVDLHDKTTMLFNNKAMAKELGNRAISKLKDCFSEQMHYNKLINVFESLVKQ